VGGEKNSLDTAIVRQEDYLKVKDRDLGGGEGFHILLETTRRK